MKNRKIQIGTLVSATRIDLPNNTTIHVSMSVSDMLMKNRYTVTPEEFKFALRPFAGAHRVIFKYSSNGSGSTNFDGRFEGFVSLPHIANKGAWLCRRKTIQILGIGQKTKQFSIWFKAA